MYCTPPLEPKIRLLLAHLYSVHNILRVLFLFPQGVDLRGDDVFGKEGTGGPFQRQVQDLRIRPYKARVQVLHNIIVPEKERGEKLNAAHFITNSTSSPKSAAQVKKHILEYIFSKDYRLASKYLSSRINIRL